MALRDVVDVGSHADDAVHQARIGVHADVAFLFGMPLISLLGLMHLRVARGALVLGGNDFQYLWTQLVFFEQMTKVQDAAPVRNTLGAADAYKVTVETSLKKNIFGSQIRQARQLLQAVNAKHHCQIKRWAYRLGHRYMRRNKRQQFSPGH